MPADRASAEVCRTHVISALQLRRYLLLRRLPGLLFLDGAPVTSADRQATASSGGVLRASVLRACCFTSLQSPWLPAASALACTAYLCMC